MSCNAAAKLNNTGIMKLMAGRPREACEFFKAAVDILTDDDQNLVAQPTLSEDLHFPESVYNTELPFIPMATPCLSSPSDKDCKSQAYTYSKAFLFNPRLELDQSYICSFRAVILFNIALIYHTTAANPHDQYETTALSLYDTCLELFEIDSLEDLSYICIAALNNKIQIHHGHGDTARTSSLLDSLGLILMDTMQRRHAEYFDDQDANGLLLNVACQRALVCAPRA